MLYFVVNIITIVIIQAVVFPHTLFFVAVIEEIDIFFFFLQNRTQMADQSIFQASK